MKSSFLATRPGKDRDARLLSAFVIPLLVSTIFELATSEIPVFSAVSVVEQAGLGIAWFLATRPIYEP